MRKFNHFPVLFTIVLCFIFCQNLKAQQIQKDSLPPTLLGELIISRMHLNDSVMNAPASVSILSAAVLTRNNNSDISIPLNTTAGVYMQSGGYNTNRISIRGIGARTPYGTNKIRAFYGSIPLTSGDSETTIEDIDIENISQIEIIKGPLSSIYGSGLGGAILLAPKLFGNVFSVSTTHGSFGLTKNNLNFQISSSSSSLNLSYHQLTTEGWRENSAYNREGITLAGELSKNPNGKLTYFSNFTYVKAFIPSSINKDTFDNNPQAAAATWRDAQGFERYDSYLIGLSYDSKLFDKIENSSSVFVNHKESNEPRPFDILLQNTTGFGARTQFTGFVDSAKKLKYLFGAEFFSDGFKGRTFENLYQENNGMGSLQGNLISASNQTRNFYNVFSQFRFVVSPKTEVQAGLNLNKTRFELDGVIPDVKHQSYSYDVIWSPQISLLFKPSASRMFYTSVSRGFSLPSVEETLTANGSINTSIKPESGYNFEIGHKGWFANKKVYVEFSVYRMQIKDLLVAQRVGDDQYVGVNAGETIHQGIEMTTNYSAELYRGFSVEAFASGSIGDYEFREFNNNGVEYSGNNLTGVPANKANAGVILKKNGIYLSVDYQFIDAIPINDANSLYSNSYQLVNLKAGYNFAVTAKITAQLAAGINNFTNEKYASMLLVNATAPQNGSPRFYYPGLKENYYGTFLLKYSL